MTGAPEGSPKVVLCGFMEKPGIEPATPGLQGIALIHYTTGAEPPIFLFGLILQLLLVHHLICCYSLYVNCSVLCTGFVKAVILM